MSVCPADCREYEIIHSSALFFSPPHLMPYLIWIAGILIKVVLSNLINILYLRWNDGQYFKFLFGDQ